MKRTLLFVAVAATLALAERLEDTFFIPGDHPAIHYDATPADDPVGRLDTQLQAGKAKLDYDAKGFGYLAPLLKTLGINVDSQVLVFSKTSTQNALISPVTPRAIYFNDEVAVGYVQKSDVLEISSLDPKRGIVMYTFDVEQSKKPEFSRRDDCLRCHQGPVTLGVPGVLISSVHPQSDGARESHGGSFMTDHRIPFSDRWGGWYVTGTHGKQTHFGNNPLLVDPVHPGGPAGASSQNVTSLAQMFDTSKYLAPTSDLVALMTLEHQVRMTNLMTRIGWDARIAVHDKKLDEKQLNTEIEEMLKYMLFADAAPLKEPVAGVSTFTQTFPQRGPRDKQGRSLRDFDLKTRVFRYPLSYMIYSAAFDGMPDIVRDRVYQRVYEVLSGKDQSKPFDAIPADERAVALAIVRETKSNLPAYWK